MEVLSGWWAHRRFHREGVKWDGYFNSSYHLTPLRTRQDCPYLRGYEDPHWRPRTRPNWPHHSGNIRSKTQSHLLPVLGKLNSLPEHLDSTWESGWREESNKRREGSF